MSRPSLPLQTATRDGERALVVPRWTTPPRLGRALLVGLAVLATAVAVWTGASGGRGAALALGTTALLLAAVVVRDSVRMPYSGGVWLTPTRLVHELGREHWALDWDDVGGISHDGDDLVVSARDGTPHTVRAHLLVTDQRTVGALVDGFSEPPSRRESLGTEESLRLAEQTRRTTEPVGFRVVVQGAPPSSRRGLFLASLVVAVLVLAVAALGRST